MSKFSSILGWIALAAFLVGVIMKLAGVSALLNAPPVAWWRAAIFLVALGILGELQGLRGDKGGGTE